MKRLLRGLATLLTAVLLFIPLGNTFDKVPGPLTEFGFAPDKYVDLSESVVSVITIGTGLGMVAEFDEATNTIKYKAVHGFFVGKGSGVVVRGGNGNTYVLTNAHVVIPDFIRVSLGTALTLITPILKVTSQSTYVGSWSETTRVECKIVWNSQDPTTAYDIAILKPISQDTYLKPIPYETLRFGMIGKLQQSDAVTVVTGYRDPDPSKEFPVLGVYPDREWWYEARYGKVLSLQPFPFNPESLPWFGMTDITTDIKIYPGDSGSPVFVWDNGKPYLIGLMRAMSQKVEDYTLRVVGFRSFFTYFPERVLRYLVTQGLD